MSKYMIHTCPDRKWYVDEYLVPSMLEQGIRNENIEVYNDSNRDGHLKAFLKSCQKVTGNGTWHLQDDVIIDSSFRVKTEAYDEGIVCAFCNNYSKSKDVTGYTTVDKMWYSMPCMRLPDEITCAFMVWLTTDSAKTKYGYLIETNKHSDVLLQEFLREKYPEKIVLNLAPNLVNHIDHLIGGSLINSTRSQGLEDIMSIYWKSPKLIGDIERKLSCR